VSTHEYQGNSVVRLEDRWLIRRFNAGDTQALRRIYENHKPSLLGVARALLNDASAAEDVLHDVFVSFAAQAGRFALKGSLKGYLAICVANRARNVNRQDRRPDPLDGAECPRRQGNASQAVLEAEQHGIVTSAMEQLPPEQREVIALHVLGALRFREIAHESGESINTIQSRYRYGLKKLRSLLDGQVDL
jgi:RNA polymerase sigma factor (sigma-70 family)